MGKIIRNLSIKQAIVCFMILFVLIDILLCTFTSYICNLEIKKISDKYPQKYEQYFLTTQEGELLGGEGAYISKENIEYTDSDNKMVKMFEILPTILNPTYSVICVILAIILFYNIKLKKPLVELNRASNMIANNNLDFSIEYDSKDEMGKLCESFKKMRSALVRNNKEMWRQVDERKKLNSAFAHELRTPLTIIKGYNEMLLTNSDNQVKNTIKIMSKNVERIEKYVDNMSKMQKLEEITPNIQATKLEELLKNVKENIKILENNKIKIDVKSDVKVEMLYLDLDMIMQVFNNIISNSIRYANKLIQVEITEDDENVYISIRDDGKGFSKKALKNATNPYYSENKEDNNNFGLGLYISKLFCELNNGFLEIYNENGACVKISLKNQKSR